MTQELPKQELLLKLLGMTTSASDNEALMAIRRANELLQRAGWTWEMLIHSKIKIIPSPFIGVGDPRRAEPEANSWNSGPPFTPRPPSPPKPPPPPRPDAWSFTDGAAAAGGAGVQQQRPAPDPYHWQAKPQMGPQNAGPLPRKSARNKYRPGIGEL